MRRAHFPRGFTLIELMVAVAIAAVLMLVAAPGMTAFKRNAELTSAANNLLASINAARGEAMKRNMRAMMVPQDAKDWRTGWFVFVDLNGNNEYDVDDDEIVQTQAALPSYFEVSGTNTVAASSPYIQFNPSGFPAANKGEGQFGNFSMTIARNDLTGSELKSETRRLIVAVTGRARICNPATDAACTASASD